MLSLVKQDYCIADLEEGLLCLKRVEYNRDKLRGSNMLVEGFTGCVMGQSSVPQGLAVMHPHIERTPQTS